MASKVAANVVNTARPVGKKDIYFPNIIFTLINAKNLQPNQAAFKIPANLNKLDIRSYLTNIYGVKIKAVRTMVYDPRVMSKPGIPNRRISGYKKAIVTLADGTFEYPPLPDNWKRDFKVDDMEHLKLVQKRKIRGWKIRPSDLEKKLRGERVQRDYDTITKPSEKNKEETALQKT